VVYLTSAIPASQGFGWRQGNCFLRGALEGAVEGIGEGRKGVAGDVVDECGKIIGITSTAVFRSLYKNRFVTPTVEMPTRPVPGVLTNGVGRLEPSHATHKVGFRCLKQQVVVVPHQDERVDNPPSARCRLLQSTDEAISILVVLEDRLPTLPAASGTPSSEAKLQKPRIGLIPATHDVIDRTWKSDSDLSSREWEVLSCSFMRRSAFHRLA
jgi:hypothetical protein